jgi:hypothetical protein
MKPLLAIASVFLFFTASIAHAQQDYDLEITLKLRDHGGKKEIEIFVTNVSTSGVELVSNGFSPPWAVMAWFQWKVNDEPAVYVQNIAGVSAKDAKWQIPPGGTILWDTISPLVFEIGNPEEWPVKNGIRYPRRLNLDAENVFAISSGGSLWNKLRVKSAQIVLRSQSDTEEQTSPR